MNAYQFMLYVDDEHVFRARKALHYIMEGNWIEAANQYTHLASEMHGDYKKTAEDYASQCTRNARLFQRPSYANN